MKKASMRLALSVLALCASGALSWPAVPAAAVAAQSNEIILYPGSPSAYLNGTKLQSETGNALLEVDGRYYLPAAELPEWLGIPVSWNEQKGAVQITAPSAFLEFALSDHTVTVNGERQDWQAAAMVQNDRLYIGLEWLQQYVSFQSRTDQELHRVVLRYMESDQNKLFRNDTMPNVKPVAKFSVDKEEYRLGEPIQYTNLSYDPNGDALTNASWVGNASAIFTPGLYSVGLTVTDSQGNVSDMYSRNILVKDEPYLDPFVYKIYKEPVGTYVKETEADLRKYLRGIPQLHNEVTKPTDRPLLVSDSPETFTEKGFLYQDKVNGKARLYADHVNGMNRRMKFAIVVKNPDPTRSVTIKTTNQGEVYPSIYANLIGNEATVEFLQGGKKQESMVVGPNETAYYKVMPNFYPGQGMNVFYDVETDGDAYFSFVAMEDDDTLSSIATYPNLAYNGNVRGTFTGSEVNWSIDASSVTAPSSIALGDGTSDKFLEGKDFFSKEETVNFGNYGVVYHIHIDNPPKMALLVLPRGGPFRGPFMVDGKIVQAPPSGIMMDYQGYTILARTDGTEPSMDIQFSPVAGSAFPIDLIFYPLENK